LASRAVGVVAEGIGLGGDKKGDKVLAGNGPTAGSAAMDVRLRVIIIVF
jgi:hypothetical protein